MKPLDWILITALAILVLLAVLHMKKRKKSGKCIGCGGDCLSCSSRTECCSRQDDTDQTTRNPEKDRKKDPERKTHDRSV